MTPEDSAVIGPYLSTRPDQQSVRSQRAVLDHLAGSWSLREGQSGYDLVHNHPHFGECARKVPMAIINRLVEQDLIAYDNPHSDSNTRLVLTTEGEFKQLRDNR
jgi:hypothetical protein